MIMIAIVRISGLRIKKSVIDTVWGLFWREAEAAVALIMVSITAFRSLLGIKALKAREKRKGERSWFSHRYNKKAAQDKSEFEQLPSLPGGTLTGMRTFIHGDPAWDESREIEMTHKSGKDWPGTTGDALQKIEGAHHISTKSVILMERNMQGQQTLSESR